jgi:V8-like Glu-specific endopeptidase
VGGHDAVKGRNPYMVSLWSDWRHECGGVIVAPDLILTAAHCIINGMNDPSMEITKAIVGRYDMSDVFEVGSTTIPTGTKIMHTDYNPGTDEHDVGLIQLKVSTAISPVKLNSDRNLISPPQTLTTLGWGDLGNGTFPDKLQQVQVIAMSNEACAAYPDPWNMGANYSTYIYHDMICANDKDKDGCFGDSGGPLVLEGNTADDDVVIGLVSWGIGCARMPGVYARVAYPSHYNWIVANVCTMSSNPPAYFGCGGNRDDPIPTAEPAAEEPSLQPSSAPSRRPTVTSNDADPPPSYAYTWGVDVPPAFSPSPSPTPTTRSSDTASLPTAGVVAAEAATEGGATDTSSATSRLMTLSSLLLLPTLLILGVAL